MADRIDLANNLSEAAFRYVRAHDEYERQKKNTFCPAKVLAWWGEEVLNARAALASANDAIRLMTQDGLGKAA